MHSILAGLLLLAAGPAYADTAYVTDTLTVAIFASNDLQGEPVERLVSGALVDVLQSEGSVAEVKTGSGKRGWLRTTFLTTNLPVSIQLENSDHEISKLNGKLKNANDKVVAQEKALQKAMADVGWMKAEMEKARKQAKTLESQLKSTRAKASEVGQQSESAAQHLANLEAEKLDLQQRLAAALMIDAATQEMFPEEAVEGDTRTESSFLWNMVAVLLALGLGFAAGYAWLDRRVRQRFGGIRVY